MKIALCFFGITRSLTYTIDSINQNILNIFKINNIKYDIFIHTYKLSHYINKRTKENFKNVDNNEYKLLNANFIEIDDQDDIKKKINVIQYRTHKDPWNTGYNSVDNFILSAYSKSRLVDMIEKTKYKYDYILYLRPDCLYIDKFNIDFFKKINDNTICIPNFHLSVKYNFNDRFCITNMKTYKLYGNIFKSLLDLSKKQCLHSETIIGKIMYNHKINIIRIKFNFARVRMNNIIENKDKFLLENKN
jgi:hypothetical protein